VIAGTPRETQYIIDTIEMFDVDWMSGMSAGLFTLEHSEAKKVLEEVDKVLGGLGAGVAPAAGGNLGPLFGLVRVQLIERLNAILVLSPRAEMIEQAEKWIRRLDRGGAADSSRLYVYPLQYTSAEKLAPVLQQAMQGRAASTSTVPTAQTAPGQSPLNIATPVAVPTNPTSPTGAQATPQAPARVQPASAQGASGGQGSALARNATIIADKDRNALLIVASPAEYSAIEAALKKLDVLPRQVMVEVTVLSVDLTDEFEFGVSWAASRNSNVGTDQFNRWSGSTGAITANGFALELANRDLAGKILNVLNAKLNANDGSKRARVHASPKLMAVDNTPVTFNVGRSVSVQTSTTSVPGTTNNSVTNNYQYLQTGISVSITPRISAGGTVSLEITQEISDTLGFREGNPNPDLSKTALKNSVLAQDGETIVMAGLIQNKTDSASGGLPGVSRIPLLGGLFGSQSLNNIRSETLVLVRPIVVNSLEQSREANDEIRNKMHLLKESFSEVLLPTQKDKNPNVGAISPKVPLAEERLSVDALMPSMRVSATPERPTDPALAKP
jgi:general secretion pathway protein D